MTIYRTWTESGCPDCTDETPGETSVADLLGRLGWDTVTVGLAGSPKSMVYSKAPPVDLEAALAEATASRDDAWKAWCAAMDRYEALHRVDQARKDAQ